MIRPNIATEADCTACMACVASCKHNALHKSMHDDGHYYIDFDAVACVACKACEKVCPATNGMSYGSDTFALTTPYKGWSEQTDFRQRGTSGGIFGALASTIIGKGGIVIGAELKDNICSQVEIDKVFDIDRLQGSKYMHSDMSHVYYAIKQSLNQNLPVLFTGLPCQVAGVLSFFAKHRNKHLLYTVDLVCGGIPSDLLRQDFIDKHPSEKIISFRNKQVYRLLTQDEKGCEHNYGGRNPMIFGFLNGLTNRPSCYHCNFAYAHRLSDCTIADYWSATKDENASQGVSLLLAHSEQGEQLLSESSIAKESVQWSDFLPNNPKIVVRNIPWFNRFERKHLSQLHSILPTYWFKSIYSSSFYKWDVLSIMIAVYRKLRAIAEHKRRMKVVYKVIAENKRYLL